MSDLFHRITFSGLILVAVLLLQADWNSCVAFQDASSTTTESDGDKPDWESAIAGLGSQFQKAYVDGNAEALSQLFTEQGEFIDSERLLYKGREDIKAEFAALFEDTTDRKIEVIADSVRQVATGVVIEDGYVWIQVGGDTATVVSQYASVYVREADNWKIASLRDIKSEFASPGDRLESLKWIIGEWIDESDDSVVEYRFDWSQEGNFIVGEFELKSLGNPEVSGTIRIGWDPAAKQFKSWLFDSDGGVSIGHWTPIEEGWMIKTTATRSDGETGSTTNYYEVDDNDRIIWKSFDQYVGDEKQADVQVTLVRKPPTPKPAAGLGSSNSTGAAATTGTADK